MIKQDETVSFGWCDNGSTDGKFVEGLMTVLVTGKLHGINFFSSVRVEGNQIARQRQSLFDCWADNLQSDWLLWIDSDICINNDILKKLWEIADKDTHPVVTGTYFVSKDLDGSLLTPFPVLFNDVDEFQVQYLHPLPINQVVKCDAAGMGLVLMHKSIIPKLREKYPNQSLFAEQAGVGNTFISEDVMFFRKLKQVGVQLHAHTGAIATHVKRLNLNAEYYNLYWNSKA